MLECGPSTECTGFCADPAIDVSAPSQAIIDVLASDVACSGVTPSCAIADDAGICTNYRVAPIAAGNCHIDVDLENGTRFSADVKIIDGTACCAGFYPAVPADANIEAQ